MGATYTRQSSYSDGDTITAAHTNDEFNQLLAAFASSTGHTHDGTSAEGGPITKLLGTTITIGDGTAGTDIAVTFDGETADGVLTWKEDEDYFEFSDDILIASTEKLQFRDTAIYINSSTDGQLDLIADGAVLVDTAGDITLDADGGDIVLKDGGTQFASLTNTSGNLIIKSGSTTAVTFSGANTTFAGTVTIGSAVISEAELEVLDGATLTTAELNILDGDTSATSTTVADADRVVFNDAGTMKQVAVTDLAAYFDDEITAMPNLTSVGTLTTLTVDNVIINGTTIGHTDDTDLITLADGIATVAGELSVTTLDIGGTNVTSTAAELNILDGVTSTATELNLLDGVTATTSELNILDGVTSTASELNIIDGDTTATSTTLADADRVVVNDAGTMKQVALTDFETYFESSLDTLSSVTTVGTLNSGAISSGFGNIDIGSSNLTATGTVSLGATSFNDNAITNVGDIALDSISADGTDINVAVSDNSATAFTIKQGSDNYLVIDTADSSESVAIGTGISGTAISIGHTTSETTVNDNLTVTGDLTVSGTTTTVNSATVNLNDHNIVLDSGNSTSAVVNGAGITIEGGSGDDATFSYSTTGPKFELKLGSSHEDLQVDQLIAASLDISGNVDVDGTLETDALSIDGTSVTSTAAELNILDGVTATASELNILDGVTSSTAELNILDGVTSTASELNILDGVTATASELNILDGVTATASEINIIDGNTSATSTTLADADRFVTNDDGTMKQVALTDVKTYLTSAGFSSEDPTALAIALG
jgi:hypothetical protein